MSYKNLNNFTNILNRKDFNYISDLNNIKQVSEIILYCSSVFPGNELIYTDILEKFCKNLDSFYNWISGKNIPDIKNGHNFCKEELLKTINILKTTEFKRQSVSKSYLKKFNKIFLYGLSRILEGVRSAFDPDFLLNTNVNEEQTIRYILDKIEGLGKRFLFNKIGKYSFINKINLLNKQELATVLRLLIRPSVNQVRTYNGWTDLGLGQTSVRILIEQHYFKKSRIFFVYKLNEHKAYQSQLRSSPSRVLFSEV